MNSLHFKLPLSPSLGNDSTESLESAATQSARRKSASFYYSTPRKVHHAAETREVAFSTLPFNKPLRICFKVGEEEFWYEEPSPLTVWALLVKNNMVEVGSKAVLAVKINNEVHHLSTLIDINCTIEPLMEDSEEGLRVYRKTLVFLLTKAASHLFPTRRVIIGHSVHNAYFFYFSGQETEGVYEKDVKALESEMNKYVLEDIDIIRSHLSYSEALEYFERVQPYTAGLIKHITNTKVPVYHSGAFVDLAIETLASRAGPLYNFELKKYKNGFLLNYPTPDSPFKDNECLYRTFLEHKRWTSALDLTCIGELNGLVHKGGIDQFIQVNEALHDNKIAAIAQAVAERPDVKLVLIAGPSSSGKTTFSRKLAMQLRVCGLRPIPLSLDNYYKNRSEMTLEPDGSYDFETLDALRLDILNEQLEALLRGEEVETPIFDFHIGARKPGPKIILPSDGVLLLEGIHGLNDRLTEKIPRNRKFKVYISPITALNIDDHNRISVTEIRLLRRIVRDHQFRSYTALKTIQSWKSVRRGEVKYIFPFHTGDLDATFNSSLDYELNVLKIYAEPLLRTVKPDNKEYSMARRLLGILDLFAPVPAKDVPNRSLLKEFIGGSLYDVH